jgi:hypothetical protein
MTKMMINLIPKPPRGETLERLRNAQVAVLKLLVYRLRIENKGQRKLIEAHEKYFNFMERRYPVEKWPKEERGSAQPTMEEKKAYTKALLED